MRARLVVMVVATTSIVLIAMLLPMGALIQRFAYEDALAAASLEVQATESVVAFRERADLVTFIEALNDNRDGTRTTVLFTDGDAIGPDQEISADVIRAREGGRAITDTTSQGLEILVPVAVGSGQDESAGVDVDGVAAAVPNDVSVIRVLISDRVLSRDVVQAWIILGLLGLGMLLVAVVVADRLARSLVGSVTELARTAERLEGGDLEARAESAGPPEIREVGHALNRLATRIGELLAAEREAVADLSHRLRTPITTLRLEAGDLRDSEERTRLTADVDYLTRAVDELIRDARRPMRDGLGATCDATAVVTDRTAFWSALADDQGRGHTVVVPSGPVPVKLSASDLAAALDTLLENVFSHTPEGSAYRVMLVARLGGGAVVTVADQGEGLPREGQVHERGRSSSGSTGLGIDIARRTAEVSGGQLILGTAPGGGASIGLVLGAPAT